MIESQGRMVVGERHGAKPNNKELREVLGGERDE